MIPSSKSPDTVVAGGHQLQRWALGMARFPWRRALGTVQKKPDAIAWARWLIVYKIARMQEIFVAPFLGALLTREGSYRRRLGDAGKTGHKKQRTALVNRIRGLLSKLDRCSRATCVQAVQPKELLACVLSRNAERERKPPLLASHLSLCLDSSLSLAASRSETNHT